MGISVVCRRFFCWRRLSFFSPKESYNSPTGKYTRKDNKDGSLGWNECMLECKPQVAM